MMFALKSNGACSFIVVIKIVRHNRFTSTWDFLSKFKTKFSYVVTRRGGVSSVACIRSVSSIRISKRGV